jgi:hypothetical protein
MGVSVVARSIQVAVLGLAAALVSGPLHAEWEVDGFAAGRLSYSDAPRSWIDRGFGRLLGGDGDEASGDPGVGAEARLLLHYSDGLEWSGRLHLGARADTASEGRHAGLIEAHVDRRWFGDGQRWQLRLGQFFLPSSQENIDPGWVSPYSLTHSALNSWIGEEFRPIGVDLSWRRELADERDLELAATVFGGNDSSGALLAWRGFAWHDRLSFYGETLPLPALFSLQDPAIFADQNDAGSKPFGPDLDGRPGYAARLRFGDALTRWHLGVADNRGDLGLHKGEYAWRTRFALAGWEHNALAEGWGYAAEVLAGDSRMGEVGRPKAHIRFHTAYLLASYGSDPWRYTLRLEAFDIDDIDRSIGENNEESGHALTLAALRELAEWRFGIEYLYVDGKRPAAAFEGLPAQAGGHQLKVEARYQF